MELFFEKKNGEPEIMGHAYVKAEEYKTKHEQKMIEDDTKRFQLTYRNKVYRDKLRKKVLKTAKRPFS